MRTNDGYSFKRMINSIGEYIKLHDGYASLDYAQLFNATLGLSGEVGEFNDLLKKSIFHEKEWDEKHLQNELGDILWYIALICDTFHWDLNIIMRMNLYKLDKRYPQGFDTVKSNNREENDI